MLPGMELMSCPNLAVPRDVMHHVVHVESSYNPYAIGVVGGRLARQPRSLAEAVSTARMLEERGYNFSLGLAQVNRYNLAKYGLTSYVLAFEPCANLLAGSRILRECYGRSGNDWGKSLSCYYSGDFKTGFRHGYVQKVIASMRRSGGPAVATPQPRATAAVIDGDERGETGRTGTDSPLVERRIAQPEKRPIAASTAVAQRVLGLASSAVSQALPDLNHADASHAVGLPGATSEPAFTPPVSRPVVVAARRFGTAYAEPPASPARQQLSDGAFVF